MATLTLQPDETDATNRDTFIVSGLSAGTNFGGLSTLNIGTLTFFKGLLAFYRAILRFDLTALIGASITDATLTLTNHSGNVTGETFSVHRLTQPNWTELGATWDVYNGSNSWGVAGGDFVATATQSLTISSVQSLVFDQLKPLVEDAIQNRGGLLDVLIQSIASSEQQVLVCHSSNASTPSQRPKLVVNYEYPRWCVKTADSAIWAAETTDSAVWAVSTRDEGC